MIYEIATRSEAVLHMLIAVARKELLLLRANGNSEVLSDDCSIRHYSSALIVVRKFLNGLDDINELDTILVTIYLMVLYEQKSGDGDGAALSAHLQGLASIIRDQVRNTTAVISESLVSSGTEPEAEASSSKKPLLLGSFTLFAVRMLEWICFMDACASSFGIGGDFNGTIRDLFNKSDHNSDLNTAGHAQVLRGFVTTMESYSYQLPCSFWGTTYPIEEILDDLATDELYILYGTSVQLRYLVSGMFVTGASASQNLQQNVDRAFLEVMDHHARLFVLANQMTSDFDITKSAIRETRFIIPHYYAALLFYFSCTSQQKTQTHRHELAVKTIMRLALQAFQAEGHQAMIRIAWPLFMIMIETEDEFYREWASSQLSAISVYGKNYSRAVLSARSFHAERRRHGDEASLPKHLLKAEFGHFFI
ncbi:hypothetical protein LTR84_001985 [Exophiala bonariae]|uniref:Transcription factor domain-containing protein n=1 Tax=Exophiala bonariae TaxID=1690606 RepID=A0AAV9NDA6_9EURO|nr:hypothetical protein LTR84_001985 [Exophiala bonariae]